MPSREVISIRCPSCSEVLDVDVAKERVIGHRKGGAVKGDRKVGEDILDTAMRNVKTSKERILSEFEVAQQKLKNQSEHLDKLFRDAQKKVRETPPKEGAEPPPRVSHEHRTTEGQVLAVVQEYRAEFRADVVSFAMEWARSKSLDAVYEDASVFKVTGTQEQIAELRAC